MKAIEMNELDMVNGGAEPEIIEQKVVYYDENGHKYTTTIKAEERKLPDIIAQKVEYYDGNGHKYTTEK